MAFEESTAQLLDTFVLVISHLHNMLKHWPLPIQPNKSMFNWGPSHFYGYPIQTSFPISERVRSDHVVCGYVIQDATCAQTQEMLSQMWIVYTLK